MSPSGLGKPLCHSSLILADSGCCSQPCLGNTHSACGPRFLSLHCFHLHGLSFSSGRLSGAPDAACRSAPGLPLAGMQASKALDLYIPRASKTGLTEAAPSVPSTKSMVLLDHGVEGVSTWMAERGQRSPGEAPSSVTYTGRALWRLVLFEEEAARIDYPSIFLRLPWLGSAQCLNCLRSHFFYYCST